MPRRALLAFALTLLTLPACRATRPSELPPNPDWLVAIKSCRLPPNAWWKSWAHHAWVDIKRGDSTTWERLESGGPFGIVDMNLTAEEAHLDHRFDERTIRLLGWVEGDAARAAIAHLDAARGELARRYDDDYTIWPGPNSNTFVHELCASAPELGFVFDPNSVGKDYSPWLGAGSTASKTGLRLDTPIVGAAIGLREGVELHLLQLTFGISLDPPGISLPFLPQIPWGWFGAAPARLVPPEIPGATVLVLDDAALTGERRLLGVLGTEFVLVIARPDARAWLRVDGKLGPPIDGRRARDLTLELARHEQDGVYDHMGAKLRLEPRGPALEHRLQCDAAVILLDLQWTDDGRIAVGATCFGDLEQEFEGMQRRRATGPAGLGSDAR
jgi:hypothetical protein